MHPGLEGVKFWLGSHFRGLGIGGRERKRSNVHRMTPWDLEGPMPNEKRPMGVGGVGHWVSVGPVGTDGNIPGFRSLWFLVKEGFEG